MRGTLVTTLLLAAAMAACPSAGFAEATDDAVTVELQTMDEMVSYLMGFNMGETVRWMPTGEVDLDLVITGLTDGMAGRTSQLPQYEHQSVMSEIYERSAAAAQAQTDAQAARNLVETEEFLAENGAREGVITTGSGLQYEVLEDYEGPSPHLGSMVLVHFVNEDLSGRVYQDTYAADSPAETILTNLVEGWQEALQLMSVGDKYRFYIPPGLGYGADGGPNVEPNGMMVSTIELLAVYDKKESETPPVNEDLMRAIQGDGGSGQ
jgi:FKBP-type peptidyl-prolyl cis-trans isomerase